MSITEFYRKKQAGTKITMVTCYDYTSACIVNETNIDTILVGDSVAMTMYGEKDTVTATVAMLVAHTRAVRQGAPNKWMIADLPFLSYRKDMSSAMDVVLQLMQAGANAVKLEGVVGNEVLIQHLVASGVPVMGHIGLTPQLVNSLGGYVVQGKTQAAEKQLAEEAKTLEALGCFSIVIECVPAPVADKITRSLSIPTIGIGAGGVTDGQVLVWQDLLGLNPFFKPKFVRQFADGYHYFKNAINAYCDAVINEEFPHDEHTYHAE